MATNTSSLPPQQEEKAEIIHREEKRVRPLTLKVIAVIAALCMFALKFDNTLIHQGFLVSDVSISSSSNSSASNGAESNVLVAGGSNNFSTALNMNMTSTAPSASGDGNNTQSKPTDQHNIDRPHLWLDIITYAEGIAGWKTSLLELLYFTQKMNGGATLVEPCMKSGRLQSCGGRYETRGVPVSEIFDLHKYMMMVPPSSDDRNSTRQYPLLVSYDDYQKILGNTTAVTTRVCIKGKCTKGTSQITRMKQNNLQRMMDKSNTEHFVLHMENYWRGSVYELGWQLGMYRPNDKHERFVKGMEIPKKGVFEGRTIPFHPKHVKFIDDLLQRANITTNNFSAIHWRAEKKGMDFMRCARAVNEAKHIMVRKMMMPTNANNATMKEEEEAMSQHKFVLMSSLNENEDMMWGGSRRIANGTTSQRALQYLLHDNGFIKIDGLLEIQAKKSAYDDPGMLAIYDLIIASKANNFATCARDGRNGCNKMTRRLCDSCNHVGKFGRLATSLRKKQRVDGGGHQGSSYECWPSG